MTVSRSADRLIAVKQVPAERADDIEREAEMLKSLDHPGVVRFVDVVDTPDGGRAMHTEFVSSDTWATRPLTDPAERAAGVAALAAVVADLHDLGIAHCQLSTAHVLHGEGDGPVLCGLRLAAEASLSNRHADLVALADLCHDPSLEGGPLIAKLSSLADGTRAGRLSARELARRLDLLQARRSTVAEPIRTAGGGGRGGRHKNRSRRKSLMVAGALLAASAAALAVVIWSRGGQAVSTPAVIIDGTEPTDGSSSQAGGITAPESAEASDPPGAVAAPAGDTTPAGDTANTGDTANAAANTGDTANAAANTGDTASSAVAGLAASPAAAPTPMVPGILDRGSGTGSDQVGGSVGGDPIAAPRGSPLAPTADSADRGRPEDPAGQETGAVLEHGGHRYGVGAPGDFVPTGDWDCDGRATPAIVRPSTGHVVLFDTWPAPDQSISMPVRWQVEAPTGAEAVAHGSCDLLRVYTTAGSKLFDPSEGQ